MSLPFCQPCCAPLNRHTILMDMHPCHDHLDRDLKRQPVNASYISEDEWQFIRSFGGEMFKNYLLMEHLKSTSTCATKISRWIMEKDFVTPFKEMDTVPGLLDKVPSVPLTKNFDYLDQLDALTGAQQRREFASSDRFLLGAGFRIADNFLPSAATGEALAWQKAADKTFTARAVPFGPGVLESNRNFGFTGDSVGLKMFGESGFRKAFAKDGELEGLKMFAESGLRKAFAKDSEIERFAGVNGFDARSGLHRAAGDFVNATDTTHGTFANYAVSAGLKGWPEMVGDFSTKGPLRYGDALGYGVGLTGAPRSGESKGAPSTVSPGNVGDLANMLNIHQSNVFGVAGGTTNIKNAKGSPPRIGDTATTGGYEFIRDAGYSVQSAGFGANPYGTEWARPAYWLKPNLTGQTGFRTIIDADPTTAYDYFDAPEATAFLNKQKESEKVRLRSLMQSLDSFYSTINQSIIEAEVPVSPIADEMLHTQTETPSEARKSLADRTDGHINLTEIVKYLRTKKGVRFNPVVYHEPFDKNKPWTWMQKFPTEIPKKYLRRISAHSLAALKAWQRLQALMFEKKLRKQESEFSTERSELLLNPEEKKQQMHQIKYAKRAHKPNFKPRGGHKRSVSL